MCENISINNKFQTLSVPCHNLTFPTYLLLLHFHYREYIASDDLLIRMDLEGSCRWLIEARLQHLSDCTEENHDDCKLG